MMECSFKLPFPQSDSGKGSTCIASKLVIQPFKAPCCCSGSGLSRCLALLVRLCRAGKRVALPERLPLGRPGDLPQGFGRDAGVPRSGRSSTNFRLTLLGVIRCRS